MNKKYHIQLNQEMIQNAQYALLPGDPARVKKCAEAISDRALMLASNREYTSYLTSIGGTNILVCSTGIGGPSTAICVEELAQLGLKNFIRFGTTGAIQPYIKIPSLIITTGTVRLDGASKHFAPIEYPAVADFDITNALINGAKAVNEEYHVGISAASDTFYPGQERYDTYSKYVIKDLQGTMKEWQKLNVLNYEMESAVLFTMASVMGLKAGMISSTIASRVKEETPDDSILDIAEMKMITALKEALIYLIG